MSTPSQEELLEKYGAFLAVIKQTRKATGDIRAELATVAAKLSRKLTQTRPDFIELLENEPARAREWSQEISFISGCIDTRKELVQNAVRVYFAWLLGLQGLDLTQYDLHFGPKGNGNSAGCTCDMRRYDKSPITTERFYVKGHQDGPKASGTSGRHPPNARELLLYHLLASLGMGGHRALFIATKHIGFQNLHQLDEDCPLEPLIVIDYLSRVLQLTDVGSNAGNCGIGSNGEPVIIDFRTEDQGDGGFLITDSELAKFLAGRKSGAFIESGYHFHMQRVIQATKEEKAAAIQKWASKVDLALKLDESLAYTKKFCEQHRNTVEINSKNIDGYASAVKANMEKFAACLN